MQPDGLTRQEAALSSSGCRPNPASSSAKTPAERQSLRLPATYTASFARVAATLSGLGSLPAQVCAPV